MYSMLVHNSRVTNVLSKMGTFLKFKFHVYSKYTMWCVIFQMLTITCLSDFK